MGLSCIILTHLGGFFMIEQAIFYIENNFQNKITLDELAEKTNFNSQYFCRLFKRETGKTAVEYLNICRLEQAVNLLCENDERLIDIAFDCGFNSYGYFVRKFKSYIGCTPSEYKKKIAKRKGHL